MPIDFSDSSVLEELKTAGYMSTDEANQLVQTSNSALEANKNSILKQLQEHKEQFKGVDVEAYRKLDEDPRFKSVLAGGFDSYEQNLGGELQGRLGALQSDMMIKEQDFLQKEKGFQDEVESLKKSLSNSELKRQLGMAINKDKLIDPLAIADIERDALDELSRDEKGRIVVIGEDGLVRQTADGPMGVEQWLADMKKSKPYRFSGASGSGRNASGGNIDTTGMSPSEKMKHGRKQV